jgi:hypothetical protein
MLVNVLLIYAKCGPFFETGQHFVSSKVRDPSNKKVMIPHWELK